MSQLYRPIALIFWKARSIVRATFPAVLATITAASIPVLASADDSSITTSGKAYCPITVDNATEVQLLTTLSEHTSGVWTVIFSPDGTRIASCGEDGKVIIRPIDDLGSNLTIPAYNNWVVGLAFSPDGQEIASGGADGFSGSSGPIALWDVATGTQKRVLLGHTGGVWSLDYQESTGILASGSFDRTVRLWDPSTGTLIRTMTGHTGAVLSIDISPTADQVVSASIDHTIRLWDMQNGTQIRAFLGHTNNVGFVKFSPDGTQIASSADDGTVRLWDVATGTQLWSVNANQGWVNCVNFSPDGNVLLTCGHNGSVVLRDKSNGNELIRYNAHSGAVLRGAFHPNGSLFADGSWDRTVKLWSIPTSIDGVGQIPDNPVYDDTVAVYAQMTDCAGIADITLYYSVNSGPYQTTAMLDDGAHGDGSADDRVFGCFIPPASLNSYVRYYVSVTDSNGVAMSDPYAAPYFYYEYKIPCCVGMAGNVDADPDNIVDVGDLTKLITYLFVPPYSPPPCMQAANVNGDEGGVVDIGDLTALIGYLFIPPYDPPANCL